MLVGSWPRRQCLQWVGGKPEGRGILYGLDCGPEHVQCLGNWACHLPHVQRGQGAFYQDSLEAHGQLRGLDTTTLTTQTLPLVHFEKKQHHESRFVWGTDSVSIRTVAVAFGSVLVAATWQAGGSQVSGGPGAEPGGPTAGVSGLVGPW